MHRQQKQLQTWDLGTGKLITDVAWRGSGFPTEPCLLYLNVSFDLLNYKHFKILFKRG